ncbi:SDR family oxidoreductase [Pseudonocardia oroxyli]|uniref:NADP-dependent 3-hydroxy acid dehydrogenase YdfG n=1 Tax=Pseudonocardia oroxyli TaxID=366584 RepID=A0A1G7XR00_PSEOR|nr:SDR family oxidoreductase [Pseudonocardia oroxyli]SDG86635.1 NADP-dependent 3-hydroxy acid dehydrogenase YdfG [Pseudonocardia oroxyli]
MTLTDTRATPGPQERLPTSRPLGTVLVTGAASGLGLAVAEAVGTAGGTPLLLDREVPPGEGLHAVVDLADTRAAEAAVRALVERAGGVDAVVCCAGTDACGALDAVPGAAWERVVQVNLLGTAAVLRAALPSLRERRGRIVTVASTLGLRALPDASAYCASKFGVLGLSRALAAELAGEVGLTTLLPGGMDTAFFDGRTEQYKPGPDAKLNDPRNVAATVLFALTRPEGCEVRELVVCPSEEPSWP